MFINYVDTKIYLVMMIIIALFLFAFGAELLKTSSWYRRNNLSLKSGDKSEATKKIYARRLKVNKKKIKICAVSCVCLCAVEITMFVYKQKYTITEEFVWSQEERNGEGSLTFSVGERIKEEETEWWKDAIHLSWAMDTFANSDSGCDKVKIDEEDLDYYYNKELSLLVVPAIRKDEYREVNEDDTAFESTKELYEQIVGEYPQQKDPEKIWEGYKAGKVVSEYNNTSENVFQTGVLAETAHINAMNSSDVAESTIQYAGGVCEQFEEFIKFEVLHIGNDEYKTREDAYFRKGKIMYSESFWGRQNQVIKVHCGLIAYSDFAILADRSDSSSPEYLLYIYYSGLGILNILPDIEDVDVRKAMCKMELERWEKLEEELGEDYCSHYEVESRTEDEILEVRQALERIVNK